jgi:polysaccharide deacetylase 2 family uncharacterized protein YibQ
MIHTPAMRQFILAVWLGLLSTASAAETMAYASPAGRLPGIAIIIDDLGHQHEQGLRAVNLPGPVACAFLPFGPFTTALAEQAHARNKEVMLHLPMQPVDHIPSSQEQGLLTLDMTRQQFVDTLSGNIAAVPHVTGLNNHMGSLLTRHPGSMAWLMQAIGQRGNLFFIDSRTTKATVASRLAGEYGVPSMERNIFLDNIPERAAVRAQFRRLLDTARRQGTALGIAHPYPETLEVLAEELETLGEQGIRLVPVSRLIVLRNERRLAWQEH